MHKLIIQYKIFKNRKNKKKLGVKRMQDKMRENLLNELRRKNGKKQ